MTTAVLYGTSNVDSKSFPVATRPEEAYMVKNIRMMIAEIIHSSPVGSPNRCSKKQGSVMVSVFCV